MAGASPRGPPPGRPPALVIRNLAAAPKRMSTMRSYMQQVNALRGVPGNHGPSHSSTHREEKGPSAKALAPVVENQGGGGRADLG